MSGREYRVYFYSTYQNQFNKIKANNNVNNGTNTTNTATNNSTQKNGVNEKRKQINDVETSKLSSSPTQTDTKQSDQSDTLKQDFKKKKLRYDEKALHILTKCKLQNFCMIKRKTLFLILHVDQLQIIFH